MTPALVLYCALACWRSEPPPVVQPYLELLWEQQQKNEDFRRRSLESYRRARATIEETIELTEQGIDSGLFSPETARELRQKCEALRQLVELSKKQERELLERQPGGITAPAPRPKGTPLPPPPRIRD